MKVHELLDRPSKWCKNEFAISRLGTVVDPSDTRACRWCLSGALSKCYGSDPSIRKPIVEKLLDRIGDYSIPSWNDAPHRKFEQVRKLCLELDI